MDILSHLSEVARWFFITSLKGTVVIALIMIIRLFFRDRLPARWQHALWFLLIIRLVLPFEMPSSFSVFNLTGQAIYEPMAFLNQNEPGQKSLEITPNIHQSAGETTSTSSISSKTPSIEASIEQHSSSLAFVEILGLIWFSIFVMLLLYTVLLNFGTWLKIEREHPAIHSRLDEALQRCSTRMDIRRSIPVYAIHNIRTPFWFGIFSPRIYFPKHLVDNMSDDDLDHIFLHELAHFKRKDLTVAHLQVILQALHWFNPFVWYSFWKMRGDREIACDEMVLYTLGAHKSELYGQTIISVLRHASRGRFLPVTIALADSRENLKRRLNMISNFSPKSGIWAVVTFILIGLISVTAFTGPRKVNDQKTTEPGKGKTPKSYNALDVQNQSNKFYEQIQMWPIRVDGKLGFKDKQGNIIVEPIYERILYDDIEPYDQPMRVKLDGKWGLMDKSGKTILEVRYDEIKNFHQGYAAIKFGNKWGYVGYDASFLFNPQFDDVQSFQYNFAAIEIREKWGYISLDGRITIEPRYDLALGFKNGLARVMVNREWGFIDSQGEFVLTPQFDSLQNYSCNLAAVKRNGKWGYIDEAANLVIPFRYKNAEPFSEYKAAVLIDRKWGYIDKTGQLIIAPQFDYVHAFHDNKASVQIGNKWAIIDTAGTLISEPKDFVETMSLFFDTLQVQNSERSLDQ